MRIIMNANLNDSEYIDLDEQAVLIKALELYRDANTGYTNEYDTDKNLNTNYLVSSRLLYKIKKLINQ